MKKITSLRKTFKRTLGSRDILQWQGFRILVDKPDHKRQLPEPVTEEDVAFLAKKFKQRLMD